MNTPTKRIFYLFGPEIVKNEPRTMVWGSLTCKSQFLRLAESVSCAFAEAGCAPAAALQPVRRAAVLLDAGLLLSALDSSHLLLGKPDGTVVFSVIGSGATVIAQVGTSCFQRRHVV